MTVDDALAISRARTVALWEQCKREGRTCATPESLREQALEVLADEVERLRALRDGAKAGIEMVAHKFARAGGIWAVAERGVPLGAMSWASNVENGMNDVLHYLRVGRTDDDA